MSGLRFEITGNPGTLALGVSYGGRRAWFSLPDPRIDPEGLLRLWPILVGDIAAFARSDGPEDGVSRSIIPPGP